MLSSFIVGQFYLFMGIFFLGKMFILFFYIARISNLFFFFKGKWQCVNLFSSTLVRQSIRGHDDIFLILEN